MIQLLNDHFVTVAVDNTRLQRQDDAEGRFLRLIAWQGRYGYSFDEALAKVSDIDHGMNHQGLYVTTTEGEVLGTRNRRGPHGILQAAGGSMSTNPDLLVEMLGKALKNWEIQNTQREAYEIGEVDREEAFIWEYPEDGLVLHLGCWDLPRRVDLRPDNRRREAHNQDYVWFRREEMLSIVPPGVSAGDTFLMPEGLNRRLVRYHLVDSVGGQPSYWSPEALRDVEVKLEVTGVTPERVDLTVSGQARLYEEGDWCAHPPSSSAYRMGEMCCLIRERGFDASLLGYLCFDLRTGRFSQFDLVGVGTRWGGTNVSGRREDIEPSPMGIAMTLAGTESRDRTPPHASQRRGNLERYFEA